MTERETKVLCAIAASVSVRGHAPTHAELHRLTSGTMATVTVLVRRGLLTQDWKRGARVRGSLRPTAAGWNALGIESPFLQPQAAE